jgi:superkiller protein 3
MLLGFITSILDPVDGSPILSSITALAAIAIVTGDDSLLEAAIAEIVKLPTDEKMRLDEAGDVDQLLLAHALVEVRIFVACCLFFSLFFH